MGKKNRRPEPHRPAPSLSLALSLHQAGKLQEAESIYRSLPQDNANVLQLLGVLLFQTGRGQEGLATLEKAVELGPKHVEALSNLGVAYHEMGRFAEALALVERAIAQDPDRADLLDKRGFILQELGRDEEAAASFNLALESDPTIPDVWFHLGNSLHRLERYAEAEQAFRKTIQARPNDDEAWSNLGNVLSSTKKPSEAIGAYRRALDIRPTATTYYNLSIALGELNEEEGALQAATKATVLEPRNPLFHRHLATFLVKARSTSEAIPSLAKAVELDPSDEATRIRYAVSLSQSGQFYKAQQEFAKLGNPSDAAQLLQAIIVPPIAMSTQELDDRWDQIEHDLTKLKEKDLKIERPEIEVALSPFYWTYHNRPETQLQRLLVENYRIASPGLFWESPSLGEKRTGKIRLGIASSMLRKHSVGRWYKRLVTEIGADDLEVIFLDFSDKGDEWTREAAEAVDGYMKFGDDLPATRQAIAELRLDALFYLDIGIEHRTYFLAFSRLAPLQFVTMGHPVSTGMPNMDYFISSVDIETEDAQKDYTEKLAKMKALLAIFDRPNETQVGRTELGFPEDRNIYACPQTLFKFHPDFDPVLRDILRQDQQGLIVLITSPEKEWPTMLKERFNRVMPDVADRIHITKYLAHDEYLGLCKSADVVLDTFPFGGGTSSLDAFSTGSPVVTNPSPMLKGRSTLAQYKEMDISGMVTSSPEEYVEVAVRLAKDKSLNRDTRNLILERNHVLYGNTKLIDDVRDFVRTNVRRP